MKEHPLQALRGFGQSIWIDDLSRKMLTSGEFRRLIAEECVSGVTSNPSIFEKAIAGSSDHDESIFSLSLQGKGVSEIYETLVVDDIRAAADLLRPEFDRTGGADGFASLEVSPYLAHDVGKTVAEARRFWAAVDRPNVFIKVPATDEGIQAIRDLTGFGINVNVTLLFGLARYRAVADAYLAGLESRRGANEPLDQVSSVASFFLSRIDVMIDPMLARQPDDPDAEMAASLRGEAAIASAKMAYLSYKEIFESKRFKRLEEKGARVQKLLWASTGTKDKSYSDVKYIEPLIGRNTITTMPLDTLRAYRDHGSPAARLGKGLSQAQSVFRHLSALGVDMDAISRALEVEGEKKFVGAFDRMMRALEEKHGSLTRPINRVANS